MKLSRKMQRQVEIKIRHAQAIDYSRIEPSPASDRSPNLEKSEGDSAPK